MFPVNLNTLLTFSCGHIATCFFQLFERADSGDVCSSTKLAVKGFRILLCNWLPDIPATY